MHQVNFDFAENAEEQGISASQLDAWRLTHPPYSINPGDIVEIDILNTNVTPAIVSRSGLFPVVKIAHSYLRNTNLTGEQSLTVYVGVAHSFRHPDD
ncbi:MAG: hypothetical protein QM755_10870 [Luteolibacter sp.]